MNKIPLSSNDDEKIQSINSAGTYAYGPKKDLVRNEEEIKFNNIIKQHKNGQLSLYYKRKHERT